VSDAGADVAVVPDWVRTALVMRGRRGTGSPRASSTCGSCWAGRCGSVSSSSP